ncbi:hypothetical protein Gohar_015422 [Gossypium harknessii]|uniref:DUF4283 domain-containing protein n=1 Tax=Gossypium harknessii TaxID=34285 RepID=A0A7J9FZM9_9ROSI|nr:hypothetical protein [Gossypium harknessii]
MASVLDKQMNMGLFNYEIFLPGENHKQWNEKGEKMENKGWDGGGGNIEEETRKKDPASMETGLANLSINEEEEEILIVQEDPSTQKEVANYQLVGCFLTASIINFSAMKSTLANLWHPVCGVQIRDLGEKRYLFKFFHYMDMERVLKGLPWTFNNHLLILCKLERGEDPMKIPLVFVPFWVQIHDVPVGLFSKNFAKQLGNFVGVFLEYDASNLGKENRNYMRIRVQIDVRNPLKRKKQVMSSGTRSYVKFKYERLSLFCFFYGRLGHNDSYCEARMMLGVDISEMGWDLTLRAPSRRALAMNSIWLREEEESRSEGSWMGNRTVGLSLREGDSKESKKNYFDSILGFSLEGRGSSVGYGKEKLRSFQGKVAMEYDVEDETLIGDEGKKWNRVEIEDTTFLSSAAAKRSTDRKQ